MARGWESKSVEEQQSEFSTPAEKKVSPTQESRQRASAVEALRLKRARVLVQLRESLNPRYSELMRQELAYLDNELARLNRS